MKENVGNEYSLHDVTVMFRSFFSFVIGKLSLIIIAFLLGIGLGAGYYYNQKPKYKAVTTFILEEKSSGVGGLAGLASQFGFGLEGFGGGGSIFAGDNILDILTSKKIVQQVLLSKADTFNNSLSLADIYLEYSGLKQKLSKDSRLKTLNFSNINESINPLQDSIINVIYEKLAGSSIAVNRLNKKGSIIEVQVTAANSTFARLMAERLVDAASNLYLDIRTSTSQKNIQELQRRSDSLLILLNRKSFVAASSSPLDINPGLRTAVVPTEIAIRDKSVLATIYAEVTKNLEASKLLLSQQTPVIRLLDKTGQLLEDRKMPLYLVLIISTSLTIFICLFVISILYILKRFS